MKESEIGALEMWIVCSLLILGGVTVWQGLAPGLAAFGVVLVATSFRP
ncbi:MAG: hypothetical protein NTX56_04375 [Proteobacteria bacterium]|nr:hypothetical protein [Pseudomonadota bacterium]